MLSQHHLDCSSLVSPFRITRSSFSEEISESCSRNGGSSDVRQRKRQLLMEQIEKTILQERARSQRPKSQAPNLSSQEDPERTLLLYLISVCEVAPSADVAVILVQAISNCSSWTEDLRETMGTSPSIRNKIKFSPECSPVPQERMGR